MAKPFERDGYESETRYIQAIEHSLKSDLFFWLRQDQKNAPNRDAAIAKAKHALRRLRDMKRVADM